MNVGLAIAAIFAVAVAFVVYAAVQLASFFRLAAEALHRETVYEALRIGMRAAFFKFELPHDTQTKEQVLELAILHAQESARAAFKVIDPPVGVLGRLATGAYIDVKSKVGP